MNLVSMVVSRIPSLQSGEEMGTISIHNIQSKMKHDFKKYGLIYKMFILTRVLPAI